MIDSSIEYKSIILRCARIDKSAYFGKGYARMLITQVLKIFGQLDAGQKIYLHTQPASYRAIKLYNDFCFFMTRTDTYGTAVPAIESYNDVCESKKQKGI